jgi:hypothetical protein
VTFGDCQAKEKQMETRPGGGATQPPAGAGTGAARTRRKRLSTDDDFVRYFLPKPGSAPDKPELGREMQNEGEALIEAFRSGQPFYALTVCKAATEVNGGGSPVIVKEAVAR